MQQEQYVMIAVKQYLMNKKEEHCEICGTTEGVQYDRDAQIWICINCSDMYGG